MSTIKVSITGSNVVRDNHWEIPSGSITPVQTLLIEAGPRNNRATTQSINFADWTSTNVTRTASFAEAPDGTTTATYIRETTANSNHLVSIAGSVGTNTLAGMSVYVKPAGRDKISVGFDGNAGSIAYALITLTGTGSVDTTGVIGTGAMSSVRVVPYSGSWYRIDIVARAASFGNPSFFVQLLSGSGAAGTYVGDTTRGIYVWGYNDGDWNRGSEINGIAPTMFVRGEGTQTGSRNRDVISWPSPAPQPMTVYVRGVVQGITGYSTERKILKLGTGTTVGTTTAGLYSDGTTFSSYYRTVTSSITPAINRAGSAVELSMRVYPTGSGIGTQLSYALNGGTVTVGPSSSIFVGAFPATWENGNTMVLCDSDTNSQYSLSFAYRNILIATGSKTLEQMRTLAGI